jgi:hypothetical protein
MIDALVPSRALDSDGQLLDALQESSEVLQNITDMFTPLMKTSESISSGSKRRPV